jgi:tricorn protease
VALAIQRQLGATAASSEAESSAGESAEGDVPPAPTPPRAVTVKTLRSDRKARYRDWVRENWRHVDADTDGRAGYIHIPDMGPGGFAEFFRHYRRATARTALVVDARYNRGGHVSQLLLEKLARRRLGYTVSRWRKPQPYPKYALLGPMVALTNEYAGSDGDIFSHCFKRLGLGPLVGTRTWGGVIAIWPRHRLVDKSVTSQPEYFYWFEDVGFGVENRGTDPDISVEITPQDYAAGRDPQLQAAVDWICRKLDEEDFREPTFDERPQLGFEGPLPDRDPDG